MLQLYVGGDTAHWTDGGVVTEYRTDTRAETMHFASSDRVGEGPLIEDLIGRVSENWTVWDVGAHVGGWTVPLAAHCDVVAIEPVTENIQRLRENLDRNDRDADIRPVALADADGYRSIGPANTLSHSARYELGRGPGQTRVRRGATLVAEGVPAPDAIKVDVEGAELAVLRGLGSLLADIKVAVVECHPGRLTYRGESVADVRDTLADAGLDVEPVDRDGQPILWGQS
jgi:FkbM family methyltransferase